MMDRRVVEGGGGGFTFMGIIFYLIMSSCVINNNDHGRVMEYHIQIYVGTLWSRIVDPDVGSGVPKPTSITLKDYLRLANQIQF